MTEKDAEKLNTIYNDHLVDRMMLLREREARLKSQRRIYFSAVTAVALFISVFATFFTLINTLSIPFKELLPLSAAFIGFLVAILALFFRERERVRDDLKYEIYHLDFGKMRLVREWIAFESLSRKIISKSSRSNADLSLAKVIDLLSSEGIIGDIDKGILLACLKSRNGIVHTGESGLSASEEDLLQNRLSEINEALFRKLRHPVHEDRQSE